ncbi:MAG: hypothetical protein FWD45_05585 [Coriobacteriia bacterium]|nr:hypothetical protein [Coriobacteriia bacterium]
MIRRGQQNNILLFEVTEQDLLDTDAFPATYQAGNVLLFDNRQTIRIGLELARADDFSCAVEFLSEGEFGSLTVVNDGASGGVVGAELGAALPLESLVQQETENAFLQKTYAETDSSAIVALSAEIEQLNIRLAQRDGLLGDFNQKMKLQQDEIDLLQIILNQTQSQIALQEASQDELIDDLKQASASTQMVELNLERIIEEKYMLEQELAEKIVELLESSMINDSLQRQLDRIKEQDNVDKTTPLEPVIPTFTEEKPDNQPLYSADLERFEIDAEVVSGCREYPHSPAVGTQSEDESFFAAIEKQVSQVLTMSGGKQIHVYHEFPTLTKQRPGEVVKQVLFACIKAAAVLALIGVLTLIGSVIATSINNSVSLGQALDLIIKSALNWLG